MRLTWRDGATTLLAAAVALIYVANAAGWAIPVVDDTRGATLLLGVVGLGMCIVGGSGSTIARSDALIVPAGILGGVAFLLIVVGLITSWAIVVPLLSADTLLLWAISTARHAVFARTTQLA
jgi:hypothetical protein